MTNHKFIGLMLAILLLSVSPSAFAGNGKKVRHPHRPEIRVQAGWFGGEESALDGGGYWAGDSYRGLPPGLQKHLWRHGSLPPGLERHLWKHGSLPPGLQKRAGGYLLPYSGYAYPRAVHGTNITVIIEH